MIGSIAVVAVGVSFIGGALSGSLWQAACAFALGGAFTAAASVIFGTLLQLRAPEEQRGGIMALNSLAVSGLSPLAYGLAGAIGTLLDPRGILLLGAICTAASGTLGLASRAMRHAP